MADRIQLRRDTAANWTSANPTLANGEIGIETDTGKAKLGDGVTAWASLGYWVDYSPYLTTETDPVFVASEAASFVAGDKSKLDGIESGATADQTAQEIAAAIDADAAAETTLKSALGLGSAAYTASTAYEPADADIAKYDDTTANFTGDLQESTSPVVVQADIGRDPNQVPLNQYLGSAAYLNAASVQAYDADTAKTDVAQTFTAQQSFTGATAAAPAVAGASDPNTGVFFPAADTVAVSTAGTERMRIGSNGYVGIGVANAANYALRIGVQLTGGTSLNGIRIDGQIQSGVTGVAAVFQSVPTTAAAAFNITDLQHFRADQGSIGASSSITNQYGFSAQSSLIGATNNYGFYSNIAAGTGRWNFYANGTAANYFAGQTTINSGLTIGRTGVTAPAASDGNVYSGIYTPTLTNVTNVSSLTAFSSQYMRVGNVVTVSGRVRFTPTSANTNTAFRMSIPVASNFGGSANAGGTFTSFTTTNTNAGGVNADSANNEVTFSTRSSATASADYMFHFTYQVV